MNAFKISISWFRIYSTFVVFHQVVANVQESCSFESRPESANFGISRYKTCEPVICYADWRDDLSFATILKTRFAKNCYLSGCRCSIRIWIRNRENFRMVQENYFHSANFSFMHTKSVKLVKLNCNIVSVRDSGRIKCQVTSLTFTVPIVVGWYYDNFLAQLSQTDW